MSLEAARKATVLILAQRVWQGFGGLVTVLLIAHTLTVDQQGWYYSFLGVAALYTLFDLGLSVVLVQNAAYLAPRLCWTSKGGLEGEGEVHLRALTAFAARHYAWLALAFLIVLLPGGLLFFATNSTPQPGWPVPWTALTVATAGALLVLPVVAIVEGSGQVVAVAQLRLTQSILGSVLTWSVLLVGGGLWASAATPICAAICSLAWLARRRPVLMAAIFTADRKLVAWRSEIWPLQWRLGLSWLSGFALTQIHTVILFAYVGPAVAGQMGLSLTIGNMIGLIAQSFIARHVPAMAMAAAQRDWTKLDRLFRRDIALSCALYLVAAAIAILGAQVLTLTPYSGRTLPPLLFAMLLLALFLGHVQGALAAQLRSYRREPLLWISLAGAGATVIAVVPAAMSAGAVGIVAVMVAVQVLLVLPASAWLFVQRNRQWRRP